VASIFGLAAGCADSKGVAAAEQSSAPAAATAHSGGWAVDQTTDGISQETRQDLYRTAVTQARQETIIDLLAVATIGAAAAAMWVADWPGLVCLVASALAGVPATVRGIGRWKRLRRMSPREAALGGEL
jgi:hypothetical protein